MLAGIHQALNSSLPGSVARKLKDAAVRRYGSIFSGRTYYFNYKNIVTPYGKYGGSTWTGRVTGVVYLLQIMVRL